MRLISIVVAIAALGLHAPAEACENVATDVEHSLDPAEEAVDTAAPGAPEILDVRISKSDQCQTDALFIKFVPPQDDRTPTESMGYRFAVRTSDGAPTQLLSMMDGKTLRARGEWLNFQYDPGSVAASYKLDVTVRAVDLAGNEGPETAIVIDSDDVESTDEGGSGCGTAPVGGGWLVLLAAGLIGRRRS